MDYKQLFLDECNLIKNPDIKKVVLNTVDLIPEYFYEIPSSSSGKYHPADEHGEGGLVLHTLKDVKTAKILARMYDLSDYDYELSAAALLLHDCCKSGIDKNCGHTVFDHPLLAAKLVLKANHNNKEARKIAKLIRSHMGRWNTSKYNPGIRLPKPRTRLQKFVHECDYIASKEEFNINVN